MLFRALTGLAVGLALKELRYTTIRSRFAPTNWVPRSPRYVGGDSAEVGGRLANAKTENSPPPRSRGKRLHRAESTAEANPLNPAFPLAIRSPRRRTEGIGRTTVTALGGMGEAP